MGETSYASHALSMAKLCTEGHLYVGRRATSEGKLLVAIVVVSHAYRGLATIGLFLRDSRTVAGYVRSNSCDGEEVMACLLSEQTRKAGCIHGGQFDNKR